jgi:hypothetical protein
MINNSFIQGVHANHALWNCLQQPQASLSDEDSAPRGLESGASTAIF